MVIGFWVSNFQIHFCRNLFDVYLKPYFLEAYRPIRKGESFYSEYSMHGSAYSFFDILNFMENVVMFLMSATLWPFVVVFPKNWNNKFIKT